MKKNSIILIKLVITILIFSALIYIVGIEQIIHTLRTINPYYIIPVFLLLLLTIFLGALNIFILVQPLNATITLSRITHYYFYSWVSALFLPSRIGDYSLVLLLKKDLPLAQGSALFTLDKIITLIITLLLSAIGFWILFPIHTALKASLFISFFILSTLFILFHTKTRTKIITLLFRIRSERLHSYFTTLLHYTSSYPKKVILNILITLTRTLLSAYVVYLIFLSLHFQPSFFIVVLISAMESISALIPFTINGLGIEQSFGVYLYYLGGIEPVYSTSRYILGIIARYSIGAILLLLDIFITKKDRGSHTHRQLHS